MSGSARLDRAIDEGFASSAGSSPVAAQKVGAPVNAMTCDVEDYFQVSAFESLAPRERWSNFECRVARNVDLTLQLFDDAGVKGTFFTLGWFAQHHPDVIRRIAAGGHEVASHGMCHTRVRTQKPEEFRQDAATAKRLLEDVAGQAVRGYRAASWSIDDTTPWAHAILGEIGYEYSSSVYPIAHDHYGSPSAPTEPHRVASGMLEIPPTTVRFAGKNWPAAGGGYFRLLPLAVSTWLLRRRARTGAAPAVFYFHPWELDPQQPRMSGASAKARFRHYLNLHRFEPRLRALLSTFRWDRMDRAFALDIARAGQ